MIEEPGSSDALALRRHRMIAPDLLTAESGNILWKKTRRRELSAEEANLAAQVLGCADIASFSMRRLLQAATTLPITLDHPAYVCFYLAPAAAEGAIFVSADERSIRKVHSETASIRCLSSSASVQALQ